MDAFVVFYVVLAVLYVPVLQGVLSITGSRRELDEVLYLLSSTYPVIPVLTAVGACGLLVWLFSADGMHSYLWYWPPLSWLRLKHEVERCVLVLLLACFSLVGAYAQWQGWMFDGVPKGR